MNIDNIATTVNLLTEQDDNRTKISAVCDEITEGKNAVIWISSNKDLNGLCLINIREYKYYAESVNGNANVTIPNLKTDQYVASVIYYNDSSIKTQTTITVSKSGLTETKITIKPSFALLATDYNAGERGGFISIRLTDANGNPLSQKTLQIALNCKIHTLTTDKSGYGKLQVNLESANVYTCAIAFKGDENNTASPLTLTKLTINKKKTTISSSAKTFKAKTKTKQLTVTLKTVKNKYNGKTYLKAGKKITLKVNGKTYSAKTNS